MFGGCSSIFQIFRGYIIGVRSRNRVRKVALRFTRSPVTASDRVFFVCSLWFKGTHDERRAWDRFMEHSNVCEAKVGLVATKIGMRSAK